ncbi:MAG: thiol-disulfide oxidoreductase DCC family protein [Beijerinckiaceae bacterium]
MTALTVFYDGSCPLCAKEIALYQRARGAQAVHWHDLAKPGNHDLPAGLTLDAALARFHVMQADGVLKSGARGFIQLWLVLPGWRWLGLIASVPPLPWLAEGLYRGFLPVRPRIQRWMRG